MNDVPQGHIPPSVVVNPVVLQPASNIEPADQNHHLSDNYWKAEDVVHGILAPYTI